MFSMASESPNLVTIHRSGRKEFRKDALHYQLISIWLNSYLQFSLTPSYLTHSLQVLLRQLPYVHRLLNYEACHRSRHCSAIFAKDKASSLYFYEPDCYPPENLSVT